MTDGAAVQYRVSFGKKDEAVDGPDDAVLVISIPAASAWQPKRSQEGCGFRSSQKEITATISVPANSPKSGRDGEMVPAANKPAAAPNRTSIMPRPPPRAMGWV